MEIKVFAYPKVNLHLAVGRKREDGFHEISSIFQLVKSKQYFDELTIYIEDSECPDYKVIGLEGIADSNDNTIIKACKLFFESSVNNASVLVKIKKRIPSQAGLGGGSSDAGSVLRVLNSVFPMQEDKLSDIAARVGSDVPFFVSGCEAAVVTGRGEKVYPIQAKQININLYPDNKEKMSTKSAYEMLDSRVEIRNLQTVEELIEMYNMPVESWTFYNDFEIVNIPCSDSRMKLTGSGTCRYTIN